MTTASKLWPLLSRFCVRMTFESDWHVGSGAGRPGNIDRLVIRDADGLPFVLAKTLHGIWRDACEKLCYGLDAGPNQTNGQSVGGWSRLVDVLFGSQPGLGQDDPSRRHRDPAVIPISSAVQIRAARLPVTIRKQILRHGQEVREALTFVKPGVMIDRASGSARTDFLRFEEMARVGTVLESECELLIGAEQREWASAVVVSSSTPSRALGRQAAAWPGSLSAGDSRG